MYFPGESQEFFENFTKEYFEKLSRAKKNQLTHNKKVKIHLNKVKIQGNPNVYSLQLEFDKEVSLGSHKKKAHTTELKSILKKKEKKEPIKKIEESPVQKIQSVDTKKKTKKKVKF